MPRFRSSIRPSVSDLQPVDDFARLQVGGLGHHPVSRAGTGDDSVKYVDRELGRAVSSHSPLRSCRVSVSWV